MSEVAVVVPCFNEADSLDELEQRLKALVGQAGAGWEVVFVNDGSRDRTGAMIDAIARRYGWASAVHHFENRGLGAALRTGFEHSAAPIVCTIDSDCTYPPERLPELVSAIRRGADIATASPWHPSVRVDDVSAFRRAMSRGASLLYRVVVGQRVYTFTSMFRAYRREVIDRVQFDSNGFPAVAELLVKGLLAHYRLAEVPMPLGTRRHGESKMSVRGAVFGHLELLAKCCAWRWRLAD